MSGFKNLEDLVGDLGEGLRKLRAGELEPEELTPLVIDARELCDRLTLLRFKAHEFSYEVRRKAPEGGVDDNLADRQPVRPFRIGAAYQTSLIDAIEEVSREQAEQAEEQRRKEGTPELFDAPQGPAAELEMDKEPTSGTEIVTPGVDAEPELPPTPHDDPVVMQEEAMQPQVEEVTDEPATVASAASHRLEQSLEAPSLAEHMERQPIADLRSAFSLVEKYECIKMLFDEDAVEFNRVLEALEDAGTYELALHWLGQHVEASKAWDREDSVVMRFLERVERRYS